MKQKFCLLILAVSMLLCACSGKTPEQMVQQTYPGETLQSAEEQQEETRLLHSQLYHPDYSQEQIQEYFAEVVLDMEYSDGTGDITRVQKWLAPIGYRIYGMPTEEDFAVLNALFEQLNQIPGFPGFYAAETEGVENLQISFLHPGDFHDSFSDTVNGEDAWGATQFWYYTDSNEIHTARIGCRADIDQSIRDSIIVEEIINTLGITDTVLRTDSVVYQYSDENTTLSPVDWVILNLLYDPAIHCGMDGDACAAVIRGLYY